MNTQYEKIHSLINELKNNINEYQDVVETNKIKKHIYKNNSLDYITSNENIYYNNNQILLKINDINEKLSTLINTTNEHLDENKYKDISGGCLYNS